MKALSLAHYLRQRRSQRQNLTALQALIDTPADLGDGVALPAGAELVLSTDEAVGASTVLITANDRELGIPASDADAKHAVGYVERGVTLEKAAGVTSVVSVYVRDGFGVARKIAEG